VNTKREEQGLASGRVGKGSVRQKGPAAKRQKRDLASASQVSGKRLLNNSSRMKKQKKMNVGGEGGADDRGLAKAGKTAGARTNAGNSKKRNDRN